MSSTGRSEKVGGDGHQEPLRFAISGALANLNPLVVLFRPVRVAMVFRFWSAFKDWKQGNREPVEKVRQDLLNAL